jgi:DNA ligase 1
MRKVLSRILCGWLLVLVPAAGQALEAPPLLLAETAQGKIDVPAYLVSEKLDGVRAHWDGKTLRFRSGQVINAPSWFTDGLPKRPLDGELWMGRGTFDRLSGIVRREEPDEAAWREVRYMIFELPAAHGNFAERAKRIREIVAVAGLPWLLAVEQFRLPDQRALQKKLAEVVQAGGEGLMLHRADALYETGRSPALIKVKLWHDAEAKVIAYLPGKGKYQGMVGALRVRADDGREFSLGTGLSDQLRRDPPAIGTTVTYRYQAITAKGIPRFASFWRVRDNGI